jgi:hypothetical protein
LNIVELGVGGFVWNVGNFMLDASRGYVGSVIMNGDSLILDAGGLVLNIGSVDLGVVRRDVR